jgi:hypothetical protein
MRRPPPSVAFVAKVHVTVGVIIIVSTALVHLVTRDLPRIEFGPRTFAIAGGIAGLYLLAGALVWLGAPLGPLLSRVCALLYLPRPRFGSLIWETMDSPEFRAHFDRRSETS